MAKKTPDTRTHEEPSTQRKDEANEEKEQHSAQQAGLARKSQHDQAVLDMAEQIQANLESDSTNNFTVGRMFVDAAIRERATFPGYTADDVEALAQDVRNTVRFTRNIRAESIKVIEWAKAYLLKELLIPAMGAELAGQFCMAEYIQLTPRMLSFSKASIEGALKKGYFDVVKTMAMQRRDGIRIGAEEFKSRMEGANSRAAALKVSATDAEKQVIDNAAATTKKVAGRNKAITSVTDAVSDALTKGGLGVENILSVVETSLRESGKPLPDVFGFDPKTASITDARLLVDTMYALGKIDVLQQMAAYAIEKIKSDIAQRERDTRTLGGSLREPSKTGMKLAG